MASDTVSSGLATTAVGRMSWAWRRRPSGAQARVSRPKRPPARARGTWTGTLPWENSRSTRAHWRLPLEPHDRVRQVQRHGGGIEHWSVVRCRPTHGCGRDFSERDLVSERQLETAESRIRRKGIRHPQSGRLLLEPGTPRPVAQAHPVIEE